MHKPILVLFMTVGVALLGANADEPAKKALTPDEWKLQVATWKQSKVSGDLLYKAGKFKEAVKAYTGALAAARLMHAGEDHARVVSSLNDLANAIVTVGLASEAQLLQAEAVQMARRLKINTNPGQAAVELNKKAATYKAGGRLVEAEYLYRDVLEIAKELYPDQDHRNLAASLHNLANTLR